MLGSIAVRVVIDSIESAAKAILTQSGRVVLKRSYCNVAGDIFRVYNSTDSFEKDWKQWFADGTA
jgi:hypothetical protein